MGEAKTAPPGKPVFFTDLAKPAKDLLQKGFTLGHTICFSCLGPSGVTISTNATMVDGSMIGIITSSFKREGIKTDLSVTTLNQITASATYENLAPGLKASLTTTMPGAANVGKAQVQYQNDLAAVTATIQGLKSKPSFDCSATLGSESLHVGGSFMYDTEKNGLTGSTAGFGFLTKDASAALVIDPMSGKCIDAYCSQTINQRASWGCYLNHKWEKKLSTFTFGGSFKLDPFTTVKARMDNHGIVQTLLQHEPTPFISVGMLAQVDTTALQSTTPKVGFSLTVLAV
ncbi:hypothetical protein O6H91_16G042300 [Diphasiastrum complanatum]|uniref:Uncharacterized protein n=1 Tax=Diphasiastrum complanatum TaxID=34168 RepID=A0ACC2BBU8_DIPCM|nr:hypothetical protein O6H91_16G042300 [Diphasiastrum complanatum]